MADKRLTPQQQFIVDLYPAAMQVSRETGMSWELILAQAAQETGWGEKVLPGTHNIFNIKASADRHGPSRAFNVPEFENGRKVWKEQNFRIYSSNEEALRDRVAFLRDNPRYARSGLFDPGTLGDLHREAGALQHAGYATDPAYALNLEKVFRGPTMQHAIGLARNPTQMAPRPEAHSRATPHAARAVVDRDAVDRAAIFTEADRHFLQGGARFEYGRADTQRHNAVGNQRTDRSRTEQDLDHDGYKGVDCSSFVWRGLKTAGYNVPVSPFTTHDLFHGHSPTTYARQHFDVIAASEARTPRGSLQPGDVLMFKDRFSDGQHVAIFKGYDANGRIQFIGSQGSTGPALVTVAPGGYWDGHNQEIVGALRARPEFRIGAASHDALHIGAQTVQPPSPVDRAPPHRHLDPGVASVAAPLQIGATGTAVAHLQRRLFELDYRRRDGRPLDIDGDFGTDTLFALRQFQREHGLEGKGVAGPKTDAALERAERALVSSPANPHHALYEQALQKVREAERVAGTAVGPHSERIAAALTVECIRKGIAQVDRVEINGDRTLVRAVHDRPGDAEAGLGKTDMISLPRVSIQPMGESSRQCAEAAIDASARNASVQQHRQPSAPVMAH